MSFVVGLTGGIGSGKSAAAAEFERLGATVVDTDAIAHELTQPGGKALDAIEKLFGREAIGPSGAMDRDRMRALVFHDPAARHALEALLHPMIREDSRRRVAAAADDVIDNRGTIEALRRQVAVLHRRYLDYGKAQQS